MAVNKMAPEESDTLVGALPLNSAPIIIEPNVAKVIQAAIDQHRSR
jgi:hypothetical protein